MAADGVDEIKHGIAGKGRGERLGRSAGNRSGASRRSRGGVEPLHIERPGRRREVHREGPAVRRVHQILCSRRGVICQAETR